MTDVTNTSVDGHRQQQVTRVAQHTVQKVTYVKDKQNTVNHPVIATTLFRELPVIIWFPATDFHNRDKTNTRFIKKKWFTVKIIYRDEVPSNFTKISRTQIKVDLQNSLHTKNQIKHKPSVTH